MTPRPRPILAAVVVALAVAGCSSSDGGGSGAISCSDRADDWWRLSVSEPSAVTVRVDTVRASTAFDPGIDVYDVESWSSDVEDIVLGEYLGGADDDFECSFAPASYECPFDSYEVERDVLLVVQNLGNCRGAEGEYTLTVFGADTVTYLGSDPR